ncbi:MAG: DUF3772 domain-containing protein [Marinibacterium sp.]|nr:DUF3772 domain-containing protein [Marinibacterium sp.]
MTSRALACAGAFVVLICLWVGAALAQMNEAQRAYYQDWLDDAERAEEVIDEDRASTAALEELRRQLVIYRQDFLEARDVNSVRIATVNSQIEALGPAPEAGQTEPEEVAALRANLEVQLNHFRVPVVVAQEAFNRANGLITEIDRTIRDRQAQELMERLPSPLNPANWETASGEAIDLFWALDYETGNAFGDARASGVLRYELPQVAGLLLAAVVLIVLGRKLMRRVGDAIQVRLNLGTGRVLSFFVSLSGVALQVAGFAVLESAIRATGLIGLRGEFLLERLPVWGAQILLLVWLAGRIYPKTDAPSIIPMSPPRRAAMRFNFLLTSIVLVLFDTKQTIVHLDRLSPATEAALGFPIILLGGAVLLRMRSLAQGARGDDAAASIELGRSGLLRFSAAMGLMGLVIGIAAPVLGALGYVPLAEALIFPALYTLVLFSLILILEGLASDIYGLISGKGEAASESLVTALVGFVLAILALPLFALIWGVRPADLSELWARAMEGVSIGGTQVSAREFLMFIFVFAIGYAATRALQGALGNSLLPRTKLDPGGQKAVISGIGYIGIFLAAIAAISSAGINLSSIALVAGALSVGIGFGLQTIVQNFISGVILLVERPISEGDWIEVNGQMGYVRNISVRSTRIETFDRTDVIVPNADFISGTVTNYTRGDTVGRLILPVGVAYGTDTRKVEAILRDIAEAHPMVLASPPPSIVFQGFGADALDFEIRAILRDVNWILTVRTDMNHEIARRFAEAGIEIPFAQRDIWLRNPEALTQTNASKPEPSA